MMTLTDDQEVQLIKAVKDIAASLRKMKDLPDYVDALTQTIQVLFQPPPPGPYRRHEQGQLVRYRVAVLHSTGWGIGTMAYATREEAAAWVAHREAAQTPDDQHRYIVVEENIPFSGGEGEGEGEGK